MDRGYKKHRGLRRYYQNLGVTNVFDKLDWLDLNNPKTRPYNWHLHFDTWGYGDESFSRREPHLDKLFRHFDIVGERTKDLKDEFQLYTVLLDFSSHSDALFFHEPNPNNSQFPFKVSDLQLTSTLKSQSLNDYIDNLEGYEKRYGVADEAFCLLFKKNVGLFF